MKRLILIDAHAIIHRAYHALPQLTSPDGRLVNAVYGFSSILLKIIKDLKPDYAAAAFDHEGPTFRHVAFERYKATRVKAPDELYGQIPIVKEVLAAFGIPVIEKPGFEADDIIGTIVRRVREKHPDVEIVIVTGDLDTLQLIDEKTNVFTMRKGVSDTVLYDINLVRERYGLRPEQLIDFKGLRGDPSDNIPGVKGIGEKTALELLLAHGSIEEIYRAMKKNAVLTRPAVLAALKTHEADALFSKTLATIDRAVPIVFHLNSARLRRKASADDIRAMFERLGFFSLVRRMGEGFGTAPSSAASSPPSETAVARLIPATKWSAVPRKGQAAILRSFDGDHFWVATAPDEVWALTAATTEFSEIASWLQDDRPAYVFDLKSLLPTGFPADLTRVRDLMLMWWLLEPGRRTYAPEALVMKVLGNRDITAPGALASALFDAAPQIEKRLGDEELTAVYDEIEAPLIPILYEMEQRGIKFNARRLGRVSKVMARELTALQKKIYDAAGRTFNINSPRQLTEVLFEKLGLARSGIRKTEKLGAPSTREAELIKLRHLHPVIDLVLRYREIAKLKSTYVDALPGLVGRDHRLHTTWNQTGTATGRLSSQNPNLQNIPQKSEFGREVRKAFVAERGWSLAAFDYSQLELRIAADLASDEKMTAAFQRGLDIHRMTAAEVNNIRLGEVTPELRYKAKALNFGVLYGMGSRAFAEAAGISRDEAEHFIEEYFHDFHGIARYVEDTKEFARVHGFTKTAFGRKRFFPEILSTNFRLQREAERQALNHPIQGTEADIMKKAMIEIHEFLRTKHLEAKAKLLLQIHDELIFEIAHDALDSMVPKITRIMEGIWRGKVKMKVESKRGANWGVLE
ncbi:MAG: DNA polymerase I [Candidatus Sungbacteria bacterium]|uniref:DNA-directed DNA polymerase n=1 Tax=Candidatus Sungiibacteriota bacterium TaxID=2750080 RepID=A0A933DU18_9BACT|nr:DNA polymerase I [Candidatus Sungbacteria bacterium]